MRITTPIALVLAFILLPPFAESGLSAPATVVVPGKAMGPVRIGMTLSEAEKQLKRLYPFAGIVSFPDRGRAVCTEAKKEPGTCAYDFWAYPRYQRSIPIRTPSRVAAITTTDTRFRTVSGSGVGSTLYDFLTFGDGIAIVAKQIDMPPELRKRGVGYAIVVWEDIGLTVLVKWTGKGEDLPQERRLATVTGLTVFLPR
jgi:hypothetical protein